MANAFSIDGTRYQLTASDQTYVGTSGLEELGLDSTCTPDEADEALSAAGGGVLIVDEDDVSDDWPRSGHNMTYTLMSTGTAGEAVLWALGRRMRDGRYVYSGDITDNGSTITAGDGYVWHPYTTIYTIGRSGSSSAGTITTSIPLPFHTATEDYLTASVTDVGTVTCAPTTGTGAYTLSGIGKGKFSITVGGGCLNVVITAKSYMDDFSAYTCYRVAFGDDFAVKFTAVD